MRKPIPVQEIKRQSRNLERVLIDIYSLVSLDTDASRQTKFTLRPSQAQKFLHITRLPLVDFTLLYIVLAIV